MKILVIGMGDSIHLAKWLGQFSDSQFLFRIASSSPHRRIHPKLVKLLQEPNFSMGWISRLFSIFLWLGDRIFSDYLRGALIALSLRSFKPDIVHVLEFQNAGYSYLRARQLSGFRPKHRLLLTPYGSDIFWFQNFPRHLVKIKELLKVADGLSAECRRDEILAEKYGFDGIFLPRIPAFGSIDLQKPSNDRRNRRTIAIKGYQNKWGQATNAISAIERVATKISGYTIEIYSAEGSAIRAAENLRLKSGLEVIVHKKHSLTNEQMLQMFDRSQIYIGLSKSDGISASMIEAMSRGAIPIQSDTSCCGEWLDDEIGGFLVKYDDIEQVSSIIVKIIDDEKFQTLAARHNYETLNVRLHQSTTSRAARNTYLALVGKSIH